MAQTIMTLALDDTSSIELASRIPGSRVLERAETTSGIHTNVQRPLNSSQAEALMDREGNVSRLLHLDQDKYFDAVIAAASNGATTPEKYAHRVAFSFGRPRESSTRIIGATSTEFIIVYTTHIREFLDD